MIRVSNNSVLKYVSKVKVPLHFENSAGFRPNSILYTDLISYGLSDPFDVEIHFVTDSGEYIISSYTLNYDSITGKLIIEITDEIIMNNDTTGLLEIYYKVCIIDNDKAIKDGQIKSVFTVSTLDELKNTIGDTMSEEYSVDAEKYENCIYGISQEYPKEMNRSFNIKFSFPAVTTLSGSNMKYRLKVSTQRGIELLPYDTYKFYSDIDEKYEINFLRKSTDQGLELDINNIFFADEAIYVTIPSKTNSIAAIGTPNIETITLDLLDKNNNQVVAQKVMSKALISA